MTRRVAILATLALLGCKTPKSGPGDDRPPPGEPASAGAGDDARAAGASPKAGRGSAELGPVPAKLAGTVELRRVIRGLDRPVDLDFAPGDKSGRLFVVEQRGLIRILRGGKLDPDPFLDARALVSRGHEEQGLLGLAFHPDYQQNGKLYINYTNRFGDTRVAELRVDPSDPDRVLPSSERVIFKLEQPWRNHNGGNVVFGPDGKLYVGTGDGGAAGDPRGAAQDRARLWGKMLRFDVSRSHPKPELVDWGLRNPWRYAFDRDTGDLYIGDVGQDRYEYVHVVGAGDLEGHNFGWNVTEGFHCFHPEQGCDRSGLTPPVVEYDHEQGCSITGGRVYRGKAIPALDGVYFYADYCTALLRSFRWSAEGGVRDHWDWKPVLDPNYRLASISSFAEDADGELYILSLDGVLYELVPKSE